MRSYFFVYAVLAQLVERIHGKDEVAGSNPANGFQSFQSKVDVMQFVDCMTSTFLYLECVIEGNKRIKWDIVLATSGNFFGISGNFYSALSESSFSNFLKFLVRFKILMAASSEGPV